MKDILIILVPLIASLFLVLAIIYIISSRRIISIDSALGRKCIVTVEVNNFAGRGQVRIGKQTFACRTLYDEDLYEVGEKVIVVAIEGPKVVCKRI